MCGIVGLISRWSGGFSFGQQELFKQMVAMDSIRGPDSTGMFGVTQDNRIEWCKGDADGNIFTSSDVYTKFAKRMVSQYRIAIGHNRKATIGSVTPENAHPFVNQHIILVHNGTLHNADDLNKEAEVDSMAICEALAKHDAKAALKLLNGPFALVWYDTQLQTLNVARNDGRPLSYMQYSEFWVIASEPLMPYWLTTRQNVKPEMNTESKDFEPLKIYTWQLDKIKDPPAVEPFEEYKFEVTPFTGGYYGQTNVVAPFTRSTAQGQHGLGSNTSAGYLLGEGASGVTTNPHIATKTGRSWRENDIVTVKFDDEQPGNGGATLFLGHPIIDDEVYEDILINYMCPATDSKRFGELIIEGATFSCLVENYSVYRSFPILRVHKPIENTTYRTKNGQYYPRGILTKVLQDGCMRCKQPIPFEKYLGTIVAQKKGDNTWRVVCEGCITTSVENAQMRKQGTIHVG